MGFLLTWIVGGIISYLLHRFNFRKIFGDPSNEGSYAYEYGKIMCGNYSWIDKDDIQQAVKTTKIIAFITCFIPYVNFWLASVFLLINWIAKTISSKGNFNLF